MSRQYIDFISAYCDSWCERCGFTDRCSHFAVKLAETMCDGDFTAAIELAIGPGRVPGDPPRRNLQERMAEWFGDQEEPSDRELEEIGREIDERRQRPRGHALAETSYDYVIAGRRWLEKNSTCVTRDNALLHSALEFVQWDLFLIHVKIMRALNGRDEDPKGKFWKSRVQNDWNGSAKVALMSIDRSERAWRDIAAALQDEAANVLAESLARLRAGMNRDLPRAMEFRRPGFDET